MSAAWGKTFKVSHHLDAEDIAQLVAYHMCGLAITSKQPIPKLFPLTRPVIESVVREHLFGWGAFGGRDVDEAFGERAWDESLNLARANVRTAYRLDDA